MRKTQYEYRTEVFPDRESLVHAVEKLQTESEIMYEVFSPEPLSFSRYTGKGFHKKASIWALIASIVGIGLSIYFIYWTSSVDYRINTGGKEFFSIIYSVPLVFEISVLFALASLMITFLYFSKLPKWRDEENDLAGKYAIVYKTEKRS